MSQKIIIQPPDPDHKLTADLINEEVEASDDSSSSPQESSDFTQTSEDTVQLLLEESPNKNRFLSSTAIYLVIYIAVLALMGVFVHMDTIRARYWSRATRSYIFSWIAFGLSIGIKLVAGFIGVRKVYFALPIFVVDCLLSAYAFLGIYFFSEDYTAGEKRYHIYEFMVFIPFILLGVCLAFIASTFVPSQKLRYNAFVGFALMEILMIGGVIGCVFLWDTGNITSTNYIWLSVILTIFNAYLALNSYLVVNYRTVKFNESDHIWNFYCYFIDWFSWLWIDLISNTKFMKRRRRRKAREARNKQIIERKLTEEKEKVLQNRNSRMYKEDMVATKDRIDMNNTNDMTATDINNGQANVYNRSGKDVETANRSLRKTLVLTELPKFNKPAKSEESISETESESGNNSNSTSSSGSDNEKRSNSSESSESEKSDVNKTLSLQHVDYKADQTVVEDNDERVEPDIVIIDAPVVVEDSTQQNDVAPLIVENVEEKDETIPDIAKEITNNDENTQVALEEAVKEDAKEVYDEVLIAVLDGKVDEYIKFLAGQN